MIRFENVTKGYWINGEYKLVLDNLNATLPSGKAIGLLGRNGAGKSTLLQLVAGTLPPDSGQVLTDGVVSFPVGFGGSFHRDLTGAQNARFLARIYGVDSEELVAFVEDFAEIGEHFHMPVRSYSSGMKSRLAFGISMGIPFSVYLVDEVTAVGDARFKEKSRALFKDRMRKSGAIMVSHSMGQMRQFCNAGMVLHNGKLEYFEWINPAIRRHEELMGVS